ncbi:MAG TPA: hypothetical protein VFQ80_05485 [Thermomicrobiales bacterium]|nr:hypothetical protein [Thermomicrobiales bacterium]
MVTSDRSSELVPPPERSAVSFARLLWVGPLTVGVAFLVNWLMARLVIAVDPALASMGQLGRPLVILTLEGAIAAVLVFALVAWLAPDPIAWFRRLAIVALLASLIPDLLLGLGGAARRAGSGLVGPLIQLGNWLPGGSPPASRPAGAATTAMAAAPAGLPWERVLVLMLLHVATALICIVLLTTLTRVPVLPAPAATDATGRAGPP